MKQQIVPYWCRGILHKNLEKDNLDFCCRCGLKKPYHQKGDGKIIHTLCSDCYEYVFGVVIKSKKDLQKIENASYYELNREKILKKCKERYERGKLNHFKKKKERLEKEIKELEGENENT
jgi:hypothetical protein